MLRLTAIILSAASIAFAGLDPAKPVDQYLHDVWRADSGLPQSTVTVIAQTHDGYLWIGTEEGLVRYDGVTFTTFHTGNAPFKNNIVLSILEDRHGALWVGTKGGLTRLRSSQDKTFTTADGLAANVVTSLREDRVGDVWAGTDGGGVSRFHSGAIQNYGVSEGLPSRAVFTIAQDHQGTLWFGTGAGLARWDNGRFQAQSGLPNPDVRALLPESDGTMWIGTNGGGLVRWQGGSMTVFTARQGLRGNAVRAILRDSEGTLWVGALDSGLHRFRNGRFEAAAATNGSPAPRDVWALLEDREGSLWTGTIGAGLHRYRDSKITVMAADPARPDDTVLGVFEDSTGALWLGTKAGGVNRWKDGKVTSYGTRQGLSDPLVFSIAEDRDGDIWVGTRNGLNRIHRGRIKVYTMRDGLPSNTVPAMLKDRQDRLWIATRKGLCRWEDGKFVTFTTADGLANNFVISLREAPDGSIWAGTAGSGASRLHDGYFDSYGPGDGLSNGVIFDIHADADGTIWFATSGGGLNRWKKGRITHITAKDGLFDNTVFRILEDGQKRFWLSSNRGISVVERRELNDFADGRIGFVRTRSFSQADGLKSQECNGGFQPSGWEASDGKLYFPTTQGAAVIDPAGISRNVPVPDVVLEKAIINGHPTDPTHSGEVAPGVGNLEFHYSAPTFLAPRKLSFRYRLEGFDSQWVDAGARREAYYTNLPAGRYRFRVMAAGEDGIWLESLSARPFRLNPHFYNTWIFYTLCGALLFWILVGVHRLRVRNFSAREKELSSRVHERTRELQEQIVARDLAHSELKHAQERMMELSRQSGMAEVASSVLHNVGNVLNSVNVSATIVADMVKESRVEKLLVLVDMLQRHADNLEAFLSNDPKGQRVIPYLAKLGSHFGQERHLLLQELSQLTEHIQHVTEIIATQQNYATVSGLVEEVSLATLVEDAFRIVQPGLDRHNVALECDFEELPRILVDKHRTLQILLNLLRNAKEAIKASPDARRIIRVHLARHSADRVRLEVTDFGIGLPQENLTRIFGHGFTTKKGGHGFGLHSGALAAKQMGGSLWAESEGPGCGATFILELPMHVNVLEHEEQLLPEHHEVAA